MPLRAGANQTGVAYPPNLSTHEAPSRAPNPRHLHAPKSQPPPSLSMCDKFHQPIFRHLVDPHISVLLPRCRFARSSPRPGQAQSPPANKSARRLDPDEQVSIGSDAHHHNHNHHNHHNHAPNNTDRASLSFTGIACLASLSSLLDLLKRAFTQKRRHASASLKL